MNSDYMAKTYDRLALIRLLVEGAMYFYTEEAQPLFKLARQSDMTREDEAFDIIGSALIELKNQICALLDEHREESLRGT